MFQVVSLQDIYDGDRIFRKERPSVRNIFILYMPPVNAEVMVHYEATIRQKVTPERIYQYTSPAETRRLKSVFSNRPMAVWGSRDTPANRTNFDRMNDGDEILIVEGETIKLLGRVACKTVNPALSQELWKGLRGDPNVRWDLIYFIANPREIELPFIKFLGLIGYQQNYQLRGFTSISTEKLENFYAKYDDLYSILLRIKQGQDVERIMDPLAVAETLDSPYQTQNESVEEAGEEVPSDHLRMQWILLTMGRRAGEKVWAPRNDQSRISSHFEFQDFEETFAAGLNAQVKYVENIDVVWKEEYRIDAAFEIENSTSIYSGLLRFADLTMVAPNTLYPLFIVAPSERRNRVWEQLRRPTFRHLHLAEKVRYLSYETVQQVDEFFGEGDKGLNVQVLVGKSEKLRD